MKQSISAFLKIIWQLHGPLSFVIHHIYLAFCILYFCTCILVFYYYSVILVVTGFLLLLKVQFLEGTYLALQTRIHKDMVQPFCLNKDKIKYSHSFSHHPTKPLLIACVYDGWFKQPHLWSILRSVLNIPRLSWDNFDKYATRK